MLQRHVSVKLASCLQKSIKQTQTKRNHLQNVLDSNQKANLAGLLIIGSIKVEGFQKISAVSAERHCSVRLAHADWFHYGDSFFGRIRPENRWLALAPWQCWVHPQYDFDLNTKGNGKEGHIEMYMQCICRICDCWHSYGRPIFYSPSCEQFYKICTSSSITIRAIQFISVHFGNGRNQDKKKTAANLNMINVTDLLVDSFNVSSLFVY